ncbi:hypothetical protein Air01nite_80570 [Asanoa iriomotensis]|uniref:Uncharacterized protein n=1 Tax=Asanoa iriomotensis TaxID=234613 RepID=A0ABQ4CGQ8_9ACTN|nr:hypothetical protein Air01nite_80570 [Asanoa iriomotensis]
MSNVGTWPSVTANISCPARAYESAERISRRPTAIVADVNGPPSHHTDRTGCHVRVVVARELHLSDLAPGTLT